MLAIKDLSNAVIRKPLECSPVQERRTVEKDIEIKATSFLSRSLNDVLKTTDTTDRIYCRKAISIADPLGIKGKSILDRYTVEGFITNGGSSFVYKVKDDNERLFAAKLIKITSLDGKEFRRFKREIKTLLKIGPHQNIIKIFDVGFVEDVFVIVSEYAELGSLLDSRKESPFTYGKMLTYLTHICNGLEEMHKVGLIHRDIKPQNVLLTEGLAKICDFGLVRDTSSNSSSLSDGIKGTINYIAPEQSDPSNKEIDYKADIYSLGITMFHLLSGRLPFEGNAFQVLRQHIESPPSPIREFCDFVSNDMERIIRKSMLKNPNDRPEIEEIRDVLIYELTSSGDFLLFQLPVLL